MTRPRLFAFCAARVGLLSLVLSAPAAAQYEFDCVTFDRLAVDPAAAPVFSEQWGLLINTGTVPIPLDAWAAGLSYAESSLALGHFAFRLFTPFSPGALLQPGEAVGSADPLLVAELQPGETLVWPSTVLIASLQFGNPYPSSAFELDAFAQVGDRVARTHTKVTLGPLGGAAFAPLSAKRVAAELSSLAIDPVGAGCGLWHPLAGHGVLEMFPASAGALGPPWVASGSNMPKIGNQAFGVGFGMDFGVPVASTGVVFPLIIGVDTAAGSATFAGCTLLLGVTPQMFTISGELDEHFGGAPALPIPDDPALIGFQVWIQGLVLTPLADNGFFASSNALAVTIGEVVGTLP